MANIQTIMVWVLAKEAERGICSSRYFHAIALHGGQKETRFPLLTSLVLPSKANSGNSMTLNEKKKKKIKLKV